MNKLFLAFALLLPFSMNGQNAGTTILQVKGKGLTTPYYNSRTNSPALIKFDKGNEPAFADFITWTQKNLNMRAEDGFIEVNKISDRVGYTHHRFQQTFKGIPVEQAIYLVHEKNGLISSINGDYNHRLTPLNAISLTEAQALTAALSYVGATQYMWQVPGEEALLRKQLNDESLSLFPKADLVIYPIGDGAARIFKLAYKFNIFASVPYERWNIYVDATNGELIDKLNLIHTADNEIKGLAKTKYSGEKSIQVDSISATEYQLREYNRGAAFGKKVEIETVNARNTGSSSTGAVGVTTVPFKDTDNYWDNVNDSLDEAATDAHWGAEMTYDYFIEKHNRNSFNNTGGKLLSKIHIYERNYYNASWNGQFMVYGDGGSKPFTGLDVCGHELTHGVTGNSAALVYAKESGALNESFSDIFGNCIEYYGRSEKVNWKIGEDFAALRDMSNPNSFGDPDTYEGKSWKTVKGCSPTQGNDQCGVHSNSGVQNYWFYLLVAGGTGKNDKDSSFAITGLGFDKAGQIAYMNLTGYLTPASNFMDARIGAIEAAKTLFGDDSPEVIETTNTWAAVNVGKKYSFIPVSDFDIEKEFCGLDEPIKFINTSGSANEYFWDFGDGNTSEEANPSHTYSQLGSYNVTLISRNTNGSDTLIKTRLINIYADAAKDPACIPETTLIGSTLGIYNVSLADINKSSLSASAEQSRVDFTCSRTSLVQGQTYPISITTNLTDASFTRVWIDYNDDTEFTFPTELVYASNDSIRNHRGTITVAENTVLDLPLRMRVISSKSANNTPDDPCARLRGGQIEEYIVYISKNSGVNQNSSAGLLKLYPNPAKDVVNVSYQFTGSQNLTISIVNVLGEVMYKETASANGSYSAAIPVAQLAKGMYYISIASDKGLDVQKIILQ